MTKSYLGQTKIIEIDGEKITLGSYSYALQKQITDLSIKEKTLEAIDLFLESSIKDWTLTDKDGKKLPITREVLDTLAGVFVNKILAEATEFNQLNPAEAKN